MSIPKFLHTNKNSSTKEIIIKILTEENNLSIKQIHNRINKKFGKSISYQSARQALNELFEDDVLQKEHTKYSISKDWIKELVNFSNMLKEKYIDKKEVKIIDENTTEILVHSYFDMGHFMLSSLNDHFFDEAKELFVIQRHLWWPFFNKKYRAQTKKIFEDSKNYFLIAKKGFINKVFSVFYSRYGTVKLGVKLDEFSDIIIKGGCIVKIHYPTKLIDSLDKMYAQKNPFNMKIMDNYIDLIHDHYDIKIIITRDTELAKTIISQARKVAKLK